MNLLTYTRSVYISFRDLTKQKKYIRENIVPYLDSLEKDFQGSFTSYQKKKIITSYCLLVPTILCANFRSLFGQPYTEKDRWSATMTGLSTPIFDDLFDENLLSLEQIKKLALSPESYQANSFFEKVAKKISQSLLDTAVDKEAYLTISEKIFDIQKETLRQFDPSTSFDELERITYDKAALSFAFYYIHMIGPVSAEFYDVIYHIAGLQQYCNDILDIYKDSQQDNATPANSCEDLQLFKQSLIQKMRESNRKIMALPCSKKNKDHFCIIMNLIIAVAIPAIDRITKIQKEKGLGNNWKNYERKDLIFDAEKPLNFIKWMYYVHKVSNLK